MKFLRGLFVGLAFGTAMTVGFVTSAGALPSEVVGANHTLRLNGASLELKPYKPAHTDGDLYVFFPKQNVLAVGGAVGEAGRGGCPGPANATGTIS